ncbi:MAG TPA: nuclear transport factor 2 family protein [Cyanobacteria bacterium UBA11372]|nr:nuclear transport factor 2 family protein [Cyanobacteria bacterium UBA11372]
MTEQDALTLAQKWLDDWNRHDLDAILSHYAEDIEFTSPFIVQLMNDSRGKIKGKSALREYFAKGLAAYPELRFELKQILVGVDSIVIYYRSVKNLLAAEWMLINEEGLVVSVRAHYSLRL